VEPALLFLHGVGGGAWSWKPQIAELAPDYCCAVWEARGHGAAARVSDAGLADYYVDAREALDAVRERVAGPVVIAGHSMGGLLAIALAADHGERVGGLVLVDPVYPDAEGASGHDLGPLAPLMIALMKPLVGSFVRDGFVARQLARWIFRASFTDRARMRAAWDDQRRQVPVEYPKMFFEAFGQPEGFAVRPFARAIDVPALLFNGRSATLAPELAVRLGARFTHRRSDGGHYLQLDRPDDVNAALRDFLAGISPGGFAPAGSERTRP
jgi:pimeloyl-ACP methyl ester carboxylesterase